MFAYCKNNDILIESTSLKQARKDAAYKLSPIYGFEEGRADNLDLKVVSAAKAEDLRDGCIDWTHQE